MQVDFLKVRFTCHHSGLLYLSCPVIFLLPLRSQKEGLDPALPSGSPTLQDRARQGGQGAEEPEEVPLP